MPYTPMELAQAFIKTGELNDALEALNEQLVNDPNDDIARRLRASVCLRLDNLSQAQSDLERLAEKTADDYLRLSVAYERLNQVDNTIVAVKSARKIAPQNEHLTERLLNLYLKNEMLDAARTLVQEQPRTWRWLQWEGDILAQQGDDVLATARYGLVLAQLDPLEATMERGYFNSLKARVLLARAHAYRRLEQPDISEAHYKAAQSLIPEDPTITFNLGVLQAMQGKLDVAIDQCKQALTDASGILRESMLDSLNHPTIPKKLRDALSNFS